MASTVPAAQDAPAACCSAKAARPPAQRFPALAELIGYLDTVRGRADLARLEKLLGDLRISRADIEEACVFGTQGYRRNTISRSDHYELLALCWRSGHCTPIHDHRGVSCAFKVVHGTGTEIRFTLTPAGIVCPAGVHQMGPGYVCAAQDADIHQVANMNPPGQDVVTLHIYSPPISKMHVYHYPCSGGAENQVYDAHDAGAPCAPA